MTNKDIVTNWKSLGILLTGEKEPRKLADHFMVCWGETEVELANGTKPKVVILDCGGEQGSPSLWLHSDEQDNAWETYWIPETEKSEEKIIGKFVKLGD
jgi:hypothetical protein